MKARHLLTAFCGRATAAACVAISAGASGAAATEVLSDEPPAVDYTIRVSLDPETMQLRGSQLLRCTNRSPDS